MNGLFGSTVLDVATGLIFVYLLLAIICTSLNEWIAGIFNLRAKHLALGIRQLLDDQPKTPDAKEDKEWLLKEFYSHPLISGMMQGNQLPSYIPARTFATTLMDIVAPARQGPLTFGGLQNGINSLPDGDVKRALNVLLSNTEGDLLTAQKNIETWFDDTMDRVGGWYKRKIQWITAVLAFLLAFGVNADTIRISSTLWHNPELRAEGVKLAEQRAEAGKKSDNATKPAAAPSKVTYADPEDSLSPTVIKMPPVTQPERKFLSQLIGWENSPVFKDVSFADKLIIFLGWLLTALAVSLGAPFWFDILNKVINVRNAGKAPNEPAKTPGQKRPPENQAA